MAQSNSKELDDSTEISLIHAMKMADVVRKHYHGAGNSSSGVPPGALQGAVALVLSGAALLPVRRILLRNAAMNGRAFHHFVDIFASVGGFMAATQAGLVVGSLYGSKVYLDLLKEEPASSQSPLTDEICKAMWTTVIPQKLHGAKPPAYSSFDPRLQPLNSLYEAMVSCKARKVYQDSLAS